MNVEQIPLQVKTCQWKYDGGDCWETSCGNTFLFFDGGPQDNQFLFCPYCGSRLEEVGG